VFSILAAVAFQGVFRLEMQQNYYFLKKKLISKQSKNIKK
jgi:hypothetical protein